MGEFLMPWVVGRHGSSWQASVPRFDREPTMLERDLVEMERDMVHMPPEQVRYNVILLATLGWEGVLYPNGYAVLVAEFNCIAGYGRIMVPPAEVETLRDDGVIRYFGRPGRRRRWRLRSRLPEWAEVIRTQTLLSGTETAYFDGRRCTR